MPDTAYQEMINTKKQFFKTTGIQCFHAVQSFVEGEITPEQERLQFEKEQEKNKKDRNKAR